MLLIGNTPTDRQIDKLKAKPHVVVGSPGRIVELIERGKLKTADIRAIVVDEADRLLGEESLHWIQKLVGAAPPARQLIFASATIEQQTRQVAAATAPPPLPLTMRTPSMRDSPASIETVPVKAIPLTPQCFPPMEGFVYQKRRPRASAVLVPIVAVIRGTQLSDLRVMPLNSFIGRDTGAGRSLHEEAKLSTCYYFARRGFHTERVCKSAGDGNPHGAGLERWHGLSARHQGGIAADISDRGNR